MTSAPLAAEWERLYQLAMCVHVARRGQQLTQDAADRLNAIQQDVLEHRDQQPWKDLIHDFGLSRLDQDLAACTVASEAEPRLGWLFQELQSGVGSPYPTPALIRELYCMESYEEKMLDQCLGLEGPLMRHHLIERSSQETYAPVKPSPLLQARLLNRATPRVTIVGAQRVTPEGSWKDLVLPEHCKRLLLELEYWVTHHGTVAEWGGRVRGGPVALFAGPSGTGKTLAAELLAGNLAKPLFRVDLGLLVSKYIGETEKNLNQLFDNAAAADVVLLFDEADSLFGKRGEVREARDRYANMEVNHLLARIDAHPGLCILTTNMRQHLDPAFARRFQVVVNFPVPDAGARRLLWAQHVPPRAPGADKLDMAALADAVALTGGQIRNAALHATFVAAGDQTPISYEHVASAIWNELGKQGREVVRSSLGELAHYLPKDLYR